MSITQSLIGDPKKLDLKFYLPDECPGYQSCFCMVQEDFQTVSEIIRKGERCKRQLKASRVELERYDEYIKDHENQHEVCWDTTSMVGGIVVAVIAGAMTVLMGK